MKGRGAGIQGYGFLLYYALVPTRTLDDRAWKKKKKANDKGEDIRYESISFLLKLFMKDGERGSGWKGK